MSYWKHCDTCDAEMPEPTPRQVLGAEYLCHACRNDNDTGKRLEDVVLELLERIEALES